MCRRRPAHPLNFRRVSACTTSPTPLPSREPRTSTPARCETSTGSPTVTCSWSPVTGSRPMTSCSTRRSRTRARSSRGCPCGGSTSSRTWSRTMSSSTDVPEVVRGRAVVCEALTMYPVECVARGYLTGSGLLDYQSTGQVCGIPLPRGLVDGSRLPEPIVHARDQGGARRPRRERLLRGGGRRPGCRGGPAAAGPDPSGLRAAGRGAGPRPRHHPGRHQARVRHPAAWRRP